MTPLCNELRNPAGSGQRHHQIKATIMQMIEVGLSDPAIFQQYRGMYDADLSDDEIWALIKWGRNRVGQKVPAKVSHRKATPEKIITRALQWLDGFHVDKTDLWHASQIYPGEDPTLDSLLYLSLFRPDAMLNINCRYLIKQDKDGSDKATPCGAGQTMSAREWIDFIQKQGTPQGRAGAWTRINPLRTVHGSSPSKAHTDADVADYAHLLLESDILPFETAVSIYGKVRLPICAIIDSAGRGPHGIVAVNEPDAKKYAARVKAVFEILAPLGIDPSNGNPSRYSRLPGARRVIGASSSGAVQELLYLAAEPRNEGIFS
jgi:hypothetical protein